MQVWQKQQNWMHFITSGEAKKAVVFHWQHHVDSRVNAWHCVGWCWIFETDTILVNFQTTILGSISYMLSWSECVWDKFVCYLLVLCTMCYVLCAMCYVLRATCFVLRAAYCVLRNTYYVRCTTYYVLCTTYHVLRTTHYALRTTYHVLRTTYHVLRTRYYVLCTMYWRWKNDKTIKLPLWIVVHIVVDVKKSLSQYSYLG
mgnify:CR=1 FL=1